MVGPTLFPPRKTNNISFLSCWIVYLFKYLTMNLSKNYVVSYMFLVYGLQAAAAEELPPIFVVKYQVQIYWKKWNIVCLPRGEQSGAHHSCWIVYLFKYLTINLSKNYVLGYMFLVYGLQAAAAEELPPIFVVKYQVQIYWKKWNIVCPPRGEQSGAHHSCWIIYLFKYLTINLSKNYVRVTCFLCMGCKLLLLKNFHQFLLSSIKCKFIERNEILFVFLGGNKVGPTIHVG